VAKTQPLGICEFGIYWQVKMMKRRDFVALLTRTIATGPLAVYAQQRERPRRVGVLTGIPRNDQEGQARAAAFRQGLQELKPIEGRNVHLH
jgi:putative tryptophan/tyrosine transport system substrate-binding protein